MHEMLRPYLGQAMKALVQDQQVLARLVLARKVYEKFTGKIDEDQDEYELRMLGFNEWFLFDFMERERQMPFIIEFLNTLDEPVGELKKLFSSIRYSFFECRKKKLGQNLVLEDFLKGKKYQLLPQNFPVDLLSDEIFTGRMIDVNGEIFLFKGIRWLPKQIRSLAIKRAKKIRKLGDPWQEKKFTLNLEMATTKCGQFKHVNPVEVFASLIV